VNFNVDGDDDDEFNHHFKDLNPWELENVKANGCHHKIQSKIWATNAFDAWQKYKNWIFYYQLPNYTLLKKNYLSIIF
jgi:hypothetical protein